MDKVKFTVITPTLGKRPDLLAKLVLSIAAEEERSGIQAVTKLILSDGPESLVTLINRGCKKAFEETPDNVILYLADYLEVENGLFTGIKNKISMDDMEGGNEELWINIPVTNIEGTKPGCFWAITPKALELFPDQQVQCPDYHHFFADTELAVAAEIMGIDRYASVGVTATHPNAKNVPKDETYKASRTHKEWDAGMWKKRTAEGLVWGPAFRELTTEEERPWLH